MSFNSRFADGSLDNAATAQGVSLADEVAKARDHIRYIMQSIKNLSSFTSKLSDNGCDFGLIQQLLNEQNALKKKLIELNEKISTLESRLAQVEKEQATKKSTASVSHAPQPKPPQAPRSQGDDDNDGATLFASDSEMENLSSFTSKLSDNGCGFDLIQQLLNKQNVSKKKSIELNEKISTLESRLAQVEKEQATKKSTASVSHAPQPKPPQAPRSLDDDDGATLFASDSEEEDTEAARVKEQRLAEYAAKKSKKPLLIAKSNIIFDVKPRHNTTNMKDMESRVREIKLRGLVWGASKLVPLAYGIHKLQISCVVEDEKVSVDRLQETIEKIKVFVQSVDIAAFNKV